MSEAAPTTGLTLIRMGLVRSSVETIAPLILEMAHTKEVQEKFGGQPQVSIEVAQRHERGKEEGQIGVFLQVTASITSPSKHTMATIFSEYASFYVRDQSCTIPVDDIINTIAPAHLYAFCREHIADLARRAGGNVILPPANFRQAKSTPS